MAVHSDISNNFERIQCDLRKHVKNVLESVLHKATSWLLVHLVHHKCQLGHSFDNFFFLEAVNCLIEVVDQSGFVFQTLFHLFVGDFVGLAHSIEELHYLRDVACGH